LWHQNTNHWHGAARPGWGASGNKNFAGILVLIVRQHNMGMPTPPKRSYSARVASLLSDRSTTWGRFCEKLEKTYKVAATREAFEKAKRPGTTQVRHITIKEKGVNPSLSGASTLSGHKAGYIVTEWRHL
jgi:hypothetical protein